MIVLLAILLVVFAYIWSYYQNVRRYPKGPTPLPLIGNLLMYDWPRAHLQLSELSKTYGNVFTIWLPRPFICIMDYNSMKEAFKCDEFSGRSPYWPDIAFMNTENGGVIWSQGETWREQRRVAVQIMRDFGMGKNMMESQVISSMRESLSYLETQDLDEIDTRWAIQMYVSNVIANVVFGMRYHYSDFESLKRFANAIVAFLAEVKQSKLFFLSQTWPWLAKIPIYRYLAFRRMEKAVNPVKEMIKEMTTEAVKNYDPSHEPECLAQAYFQKMQNNPGLNYDQLINVCMDFFIAGMETSTTTLRWGVLYLAKYQAVQNKMREEIAKQIGFHDLPQTSGKNKLPYCNAVIQEIQRCADIIPINVIHRTTRDTEVNGQFVPDDTFVLGQISHVMRQSERMIDGDEFRPERFLLDDGVTPNKEILEHLIPFGIGKRQCAGEALAKVELFVGIVSLVQRYKIESVPGKPIDLEPIFGQVRLPRPQTVRLVPVNANQ